MPKRINLQRYESHTEDDVAERKWRFQSYRQMSPLAFTLIILTVSHSFAGAAPLPEVDSLSKISNRSLENQIEEREKPKLFYTGSTIPNTTGDVLTVSDGEEQGKVQSQPPSVGRKARVLAFILSFCVLVAITVNFINLHSDYEELQEFYNGYMGRKMLIQERRLTSRTYLNLLRRAHREGIENERFVEITEAFQQAEYSTVGGSKSDPHYFKSPKKSPNCNGHAASCDLFNGLNEIHQHGDISFIPLQERADCITRSDSPPLFVSGGCESDRLHVPNRANWGEPDKNTPSTTMTTLTSQSRRCQDLVTSVSASPHMPTNMSVVVMQQPLPSDTAMLHCESPVLEGNEEWLLPLLAKEFIEDHDLEWRDLDYSADVGPPPTSFLLFICQYDCRVFPKRMSVRNRERRKNLLAQFRLWKLLKRKHWNIVVTERAKKEMADREQDHMRR